MFKEITSSANSLGLQGGLETATADAMKTHYADQEACLKSYLGTNFTTSFQAQRSTAFSFLRSALLMFGKITHEWK